MKSFVIAAYILNVSTIGLIQASERMPLGNGSSNSNNGDYLPQYAKAATDPYTRSSSENVKIGVLPNGMHYYIHNNSFPAKRAMIWLAVNAGSVQEDEDQLGYAHFLEHMAFNGTKSFPGNKVVDIIEESGLSFGADLNAYTSFDETVYQLSIPTDDDVAFNKGLTIVQEWASGGILMDSMEVVNERGVVLGEWRQRIQDTMSERYQREEIARLVGKDSRYVDRFPIGKPSLLRSANPAALKRYYNDWYRSDLMAIIVVGPIDVDKMEKEVITRFGNIKSAHKREFSHPVYKVENETKIQIVRDNIPPSMEVSWPVPPRSSDSKTRVKEGAIMQILTRHLQEVYSNMVTEERRLFAQATIGIERGIARSIGVRAVLRVAASPDSTEFALSTVLGEVERVAQHGILESDLNKYKDVIIRQMEMAVDGMSNVPSRSIAERYVAHYLLKDDDLLTPMERLKIAKEVLPSIGSSDIALFANFWKQPKGRIVRANIPSWASVAPSTEVTINRILDSTANAKFTPVNEIFVRRKTNNIPSESMAGSFTNSRNQLDHSTKSEIRSDLKDIVNETVVKIGDKEVKTWKLRNGATVVYKHSNVLPDELIIHGYSQGGHSLLPDSIFFSASRSVTDLINTSAGAGEKNHEDMIHALRLTGTREVRLSLNALDEEVHVSGSPKSARKLFEVLHQRLTAPVIEKDALERWKRIGFMQLSLSQNDQSLAQLGHRRFAAPTSGNVPFVDLDQAMYVFRDRFGDASDFTFYIVGAASEKEIKSLVSQFIATLPSTNRAVRETPKEFKINLFKGNRRSVDSSAWVDGEQSQTSIMFPGELATEPSTFLDERRKLSMVSQILSRRLIKRLREDMSVTYSAGAPSFTYYTPKFYYGISIGIVTAPEDSKNAAQATWEEILDLRDNGPTEAEFQQALVVQRRRAENARQSNEWWISEMQMIDRLGMSYEELGRVPGADLTKADLQEAARKFLSTENYLQNTIVPNTKKIEEARKKRESEK